MTGDTVVEVPVDNKVEETPVKTDKEVIAEEEKELIENVEKTDEPEKTEEDKEESATTEPKKVPLLQKLFGKRKDHVVPKADEVPIKTETDKDAEEGEEKEKVEEEKKEESPETVQQRFKKMFSMKKAKKDEAEKADKPEGEDKIEEGEEKKDEEKTDEEPAEGEKKEDEEAVETAEADVSTTTAEKKTLMQKLMTIKRDLMANKKEDKVDEEKKEEEKEDGKEGDEKEGEEEKKDDEEKKEEEEPKDDDTKDELGNEKPKQSTRIKKFFSMKRERKPVEVEKKTEEEGEAAPEEEKVEVDPDAVIKVHLANRTPVLPSISAMHLKLESWLKFHGVKYENTHDKDDLPASAFQPLQSNDYLNKLADSHDKHFPQQLDADQKSTQTAMMTLVEKNIHFAILSWQCGNIDNILKGYKVNLQTYMNSKAPLALLKLMFKNNFCKNGQKLVKSNGFAQKTTEEIEELAKPDLKVLADMLSENDFFFGSSASLLDLVVFSHLVQVTFVEEEVACTLRDHIKAEHENLVAHVNRMKTLIWGDDWLEATEKLDLNPHIPKPIVEEVKEIVEEVVEKVTEETKPTEEEATEEKPAEEPVVEKVEESKTEETEAAKAD